MQHDPSRNLAGFSLWEAQKIDKWAEAYPIEIFQEPDWERADAVLRAGGMSLTAISASNMRYVLQGVQKIAREALEAT